jgi:hypothetical protein
MAQYQTLGTSTTTLASFETCRDTGVVGDLRVSGASSLRAAVAHTFSEEATVARLAATSKFAKDLLDPKPPKPAPTPLPPRGFGFDTGHFEPFQPWPQGIPVRPLHFPLAQGGGVDFFDGMVCTEDEIPSV